MIKFRKLQDFKKTIKKGGVFVFFFFFLINLFIFTFNDPNSGFGEYFRVRHTKQYLSTFDESQVARFENIWPILLASILTRRKFSMFVDLVNYFKHVTAGYCKFNKFCVKFLSYS